MHDDFACALVGALDRELVCRPELALFCKIRLCGVNPSVGNSTVRETPSEYWMIEVDLICGSGLLT